MKRVFTALCGLVFAATLVGCGSTTDNLNFKAPPGYDSKINTFLMSVWSKGAKDDPTDVVMLVKIPTKLDETKLDNLDPSTFTTSGGIKNAKIQSSSKIQICGTHPAILVKASGTSDQAKGHDMNMEMLLTGWESNTYMAMYLYPQGGTADPAGEAAIKSVCEKEKTS